MTWLITSELANQRVRKALFHLCGIYLLFKAAKSYMVGVVILFLSFNKFSRHNFIKLW